jgi:hypothetical protein
MRQTLGQELLSAVAARAAKEVAPSARTGSDYPFMGEVQIHTNGCQPVYCQHVLALGSPTVEHMTDPHVLFYKIGRNGRKGLSDEASRRTNRPIRRVSKH